jgi:hypothetical protein
MKLKFIKAHEIDKNVKCAIHKTGKLGFSSAAIKKLEITPDKSIGIAINEEDDTDENLYMAIHSGVNDEHFKISKAGEYYYVNTKALFDKMGIDYRNRKIIYDIVDFEYEDFTMFKLIRREVKQKE